MIALLVDPRRTLSQVLLLIAAVIFLLEFLAAKLAPEVVKLPLTQLAWTLVAVALIFL